MVTPSGKDKKKEGIQLTRKKSEGSNLPFKAVSYLIFYLLLFLFILSFLLYFYSYISMFEAELYITALFSLLLPASAFAYLAHTGRNINEAAHELGILQNLKLLKIISIGILFFMLILLLEVGITLISEIINIRIATNACDAITGMPIWFIAFVSLIGPIDEELFFRGFLVKRIGIVPSAALFAVLHAGYGSSFGIDIIAAFIFGLVAGYIFKKTNSIYPSMLSHVLVNLIAVIGCI
ncbi:MAG: CPBP family intramembrane glutamic endopeptidase [Candidatus Micrarchaeia archaeon]